MSRKLPNQIYRDLNISQRIRAAWEAERRKDTAELEKLKSPSEAGEYVISRVSAVMLDLHFIQMTAQADILSNLTHCLLNILRLKESKRDEETEEILQTINDIAPNLAAITCALKELAEDFGMEGDSLLDLSKNLPPLAQTLIERHIDHPPEALVKNCKGIFSDFLRERHPKVACFHPAKQE